MLAGCASVGIDKNYAAALEAHHAIEQARYQVEIERARSEQARFSAMQAIAASADAQTKAMALIALASAGGRAELPVAPASAAPALPESGTDKALKWASVLLPALGTVTNGLINVRLATVQSDNARDVALASYSSLQGIASGGFSALTTTAGLIQAPQANVTLSGTGVIGGGSYVGPYSGQNSGVSGIVGSENNSPKPVTTTTTTTETTTTTRNCVGGGTGTTGTAGGASC